MLEEFCDWLIYSVFGFESGSALGDSVNFFVYDSIKILLLLYLMIAVVGVLRTFISPSKVKNWLSGKHKGLAYLFASLFGAVTPFCSCSSIPIFMSFIEAGVPLGPTFSFLVTSPLINEYLVVLMVGFFGVEITLAYIGFGLFLGILSGIIVSRLDVGKYIVEEFRTPSVKTDEVKYDSFRQRVGYGLSEASDLVRKLWMWVLLGVGVGATIHGFVPEEFIHGILETTGIFSVPLAVLVGVPIYANCSAVVPIAAALFGKGVPLGTALAFMMATAALSLPEAIILRRVMKLPLIALFFSIVATGIILIGYLFNAIA